MYIRGGAGQVWVGELLDPVTLLGRPGLAPQVQITVDGAAPIIGTGAMDDLGRGAYRYHFQIAEIDGASVGVLLFADGVVPDRVTISPFDPGFGAPLELWQYGGSQIDPAVRTLYADETSGLSASNIGSGQDVLGLYPASQTQQGAVSTGDQDWLGVKYTDGPFIAQNGFYSDPVYPHGISPFAGLLYSQTFTGVVLGAFNADLTNRTVMYLSDGGSGTGGFHLAAYDPISGQVDPQMVVYDSLGLPNSGQWATVSGLTFAAGLYTGGSLAPAWSSITGTPTTLGGYGVSTPIGLADGGSAADLSGTGPGLVEQASLGAPFSSLAPGTNGDVLTVVGGAWTSAPAAGGVSGSGTAGQVAYWSGSTAVTGDTNFLWDAVNQTLSVNGGSTYALFVTGSGFQADLCQPGGALQALDATHTTLLSTSAAALDASDTGRFARMLTSGHVLDMSDGVRSAQFCDGSSYAAVFSGGSVFVDGVTGSTLFFGSAAPAPTPQAVALWPGSAYGAGLITDVLGDPDQWAYVYCSGVLYKTPLYLP